MNNTVFISYKSEDRELIKPYLNMLTEHGIHFWWDQQIDGKWGKEIEQALASAKLVLGFVTENSMKSGPVFAEFRRAEQQDKLIPIRLDKAPYTYEFETILGLLNYFDLSTADRCSDNSNPELQRLLERVKNRIFTDTASREYTERKLVRSVGYESWFNTPEKLALFPYLMSLCVFEGFGHEKIQLRADQLQKKLVEYGFSTEIFGFRRIQNKSDRLAVVGAKVQSFQSDSLPYPIEYLEFVDRNFKDQFLDYVWREMDQFNGVIIEWFQRLISNDYGNQNLNRVALALSIIGRKHFNSIYVNVILQWLRSENQEEVDCADLALSLMNADATILDFIKKSINELTYDLNDDFALKIAMRLSCGYTGTSLPNVAISLMRRIENVIVEKNSEIRDNARLVGSISENVQRLAVNASQNRYALVALKNLIEHLTEWMNQPTELRRSYLPCFIALSLFGSTLGTDKKPPVLPLKNILVDAEETDWITLDCLAIIFNNVLTETKVTYRDWANKILNEWCAEGLKSKDRSEDIGFIIDFVKRLHDISKTNNDKDRVAFAASKIVKL